jgi:ATP-binding cassette subfamily C protein CydD
VIPPGRTTAVVGPSGAGKTTFINLILRFANLQEGRISLDDTPIDRCTLDSWHNQIAWVPQHPYLFNASLKENLLLARKDASVEELGEAIRNAGLETFIASLPEGLDTMIGEQGTRLSGGESQRLSLARAFLKDAPVLMLDEPTSHTDPLLEASLRVTMKRLTKGKTTIIIAHRLETIENADQILVLEGGTIVQSGTGDELMHTAGYYRQARQSFREVEA